MKDLFGVRLLGALSALSVSAVLAIDLPAGSPAPAAKQTVPKRMGALTAEGQKRLDEAQGVRNAKKSREGDALRQVEGADATDLNTTRSTRSKGEHTISPRHDRRVALVDAMRDVVCQGVERFTTQTITRTCSVI